MVMFKYDGSNDSISLPIASTGSAGIVTSKDFLDFVKQHQLQELHTEMIDTFADIRAKYQKKLIAGLNIEIDQETNVISASGDLAVQWDNITNKPDFKPVATSGDYNWDNTDASEHCLLIGGGSGNGGQAGLFHLASANGVSNSSAGIGSRLIYLPWAE